MTQERAGSTDPAKQRERDRMVRDQIQSRGTRSPAVLAAMRRVPRHEFVPEALQALAYEDQPLPIGHGQTISQPAVVAYMSEALQIRPGERVLEIGTGSGYQAAILAELGAEVFTIEIVQPLGEQAMATLTRLGYTTVHVRVGDGYKGWPEAAPFDAIMLTAAPETVPQVLIDQLAVGGRLIAPVGKGYQRLTLLRRTAAGFEQRDLIDVLFVPMTGGKEGQSGGGN